jgi:hypothetical protein
LKSPEEDDTFFFGDGIKQARKRSVESHNFIFGGDKGWSINRYNGCESSGYKWYAKPNDTLIDRSRLFNFVEKLVTYCKPYASITSLTIRLSRPEKRIS